MIEYQTAKMNVDRILGIEAEARKSRGTGRLERKSDGFRLRSARAGSRTVHVIYGQSPFRPL